uniref:Uncharacterized protein n=1 Tax=Virgibacillus oceani TaxID=1479511 RepID=A0A917LVX0_9BACI|nr:hypothetical protein GCM10011398_01510 [Virgibacillus oceani]
MKYKITKLPKSVILINAVQADMNAELGNMEYFSYYFYIKAYFLSTFFCNYVILIIIIRSMSITYIGGP